MIAVDWGTSQLRAYRLDAQGNAVESRERPEGILSVPAGGFPAVLDAITAGWEKDADGVLMSGMVGSRQGWLEVPYVDCPADLRAIAKGVRPVEWRKGSQALICPGLTCRDTEGVPDVMRGEEVQVMGALALNANEGIGSIIMAGTHSKHVRVEGETIAGFATHMTGEVFAVLKAHSILGRMMEEAKGPGDASVFAAGVKRAGEGSASEGGLLHHLFGVRTRVLLGDMPGTAAADYLSGLLIGHTIYAAKPKAPVLVIGAPAVAERYVAACGLLEIPARTLTSEQVTLAGLSALRPHLGG
ncbi:MAG TPA: 2-dehydro-3-deoxygalactonokinase [Magnetospirillaceae bacterium]|jgi:2-dehydro-3-deoxygalactonokinase